MVGAATTCHSNQVYLANRGNSSYAEQCTSPSLTLPSKIEQDEIKSENRSLSKVQLEVLMVVLLVASIITDACVSTKC